MSHRLDVQNLLVWLSLFSWQGIYQMFGVLGEVIIFREYKFYKYETLSQKKVFVTFKFSTILKTLFLQDI